MHGSPILTLTGCQKNHNKLQPEREREIERDRERERGKILIII